MKRLFVAIKISPDPEFLEAIARLKYSLSHEKIKWVEEHNIHVTVKFLGETDERLIVDIINVLRKITDTTACFRFRLNGLGIFGSAYNPRVVWIGIYPYDKLIELMKRARLEFESIGYPASRQNLVPHLTLGRIKSLQNKLSFQNTLDAFRDLSSRPLSAENLILYESILQSTGAEYNSIETFQLKK